MTRTDLISAILKVKAEAIQKGFDWPSQSIEQASFEELIKFLHELDHFFYGTKG